MIFRRGKASYLYNDRQILGDRRGNRETVKETERTPSLLDFNTYIYLTHGQSLLTSSLISLLLHYLFRIFQTPLYRYVAYSFAISPQSSWIFGLQVSSYI